MIYSKKKSWSVQTMFKNFENEFQYMQFFKVTVNGPTVI